MAKALMVILVKLLRSVSRDVIQYHKQCTQPWIILSSEVLSLWLFHCLFPVSRFTSGLGLVPVEWGKRNNTFPVLDLPAAAVHSLGITVTLAPSANLSLSISNQSPIRFSCPATAFNYYLPTLWFPSSSV